MSFDVQVTDAMVEAAWRVINKDTACDCRECIRKALIAALAQSDAEPKLDDNFERHLQARISGLEQERQRDRTLIENLQLETSEQADKIERLTTALAQSDAEPVALLRCFTSACEGNTLTLEFENRQDAYDAQVEIGNLKEGRAALAQSDAEPVAWKPDANMRAELDRSEMVARAMLKEIMKQIDYIEAEGHIEWHKRIHVNGELYLPDISAAVLASLYTAPPRPDASAGLIEAAELLEAEAKKIADIHGGGSFAEQACRRASRFLRARAADRSGK